MRIGLVLAEGHEAELARLAEAHGLFGVMAGTGNPLTAINAAIYASTATEFVRVVTRVRTRCSQRAHLSARHLTRQQTAVE